VNTEGADSLRAHHGMTVRRIKGFGWVPDRPDHNDHLYAPSPALLRSLPSAVDLRDKCPPVYDQGDLGSCTANGIGFAVQYDRMAEGLADQAPLSRLFIYYNERVVEGTVSEDSGAMIRDGIKSMAKIGACDETIWPYDTAKFAEEPPLAAFEAAADCKASRYSRVVVGHSVGLGQFKAALASGRPPVFGFTVYESFESAEVARTGVMPTPSHSEQVLGGHCVAAVGYDDEKQWIICRNSWGPGWGDLGYFYMPYSVAMTGSDFWVINSVTGEGATV
jgi:C1A family cysteine protease